MAVNAIAVVMINGKMVVFEGDASYDEGEEYTFYLEGELVGRFQKRNVAGYVMQEKIEEEEDEE